MQRLGERIKKRREYLETQLNELARKIGVSASLLSQIENGKAYPSILNLKKIADGLSTTVADLIGENEPYSREPLVRKKERELVRRNEKGAALYLLANHHPSHLMEAYLVELSSGSDSESIWDVPPAQGFCYVLRGSAMVELADGTYRIASGDTLYYAAHSLKGISNNGKLKCDVVLVSVTHG